jgi:cytochrome c oxidase cbb3-type subunit 3
MRAGIFAAFVILLGAALLLLVFGPITYVREAREFRPDPIAASGPAQIRMTDLQPGLPLPGPNPNTGGENPSWYERNAVALSEGQRLFSAMNCVGCHSHGGGGMGPPLMDPHWRYGASSGEIVRSILEGRPNGMPSFAGRIPPDQAWQLAAYIRSMSGQLRTDVAPNRSDKLSAGPPESRRDRLAPMREAPPSSPPGS